MDVARCVDLHNRIVQHAVKELGTKCKAKVTRNWFEAYKSANAEKEREALPSDLCRFLDNADIADSNKLSFNYCLRGLTPPAALRGDTSKEAKDSWPKQFGKKDFIILYQAVDKEETRGLVMDLSTLKCYYINSIESTIEASWIWQPLDTVLQRWWDMIQSGKYVVDSSPDSLETDSEYGAIGWTMQPFVPSDVDEAVKAWDEYVSTIVRLLPDEVRKEIPVTSITGWVEAEDLNKYEVTGFVREFLLRARRPPMEVKFVAPGLRILDADLLKQFGYVLKVRREEFEWIDPMDMPFPLCPSTRRFAENTLENAIEGSDFLRKQYLFDELAGLYIRPSAEALYSDTMAMISPYDNPSYDGDGFELKHRLFDYQAQSACPWQPSHDVRLVSLLTQWTWFLTSDFWKVGKEGVEGGIEAWQELSEAKNRDRLSLPEVCH